MGLGGVLRHELLNNTLVVPNEVTFEELDELRYSNSSAFANIIQEGNPNVLALPIIVVVTRDIIALASVLKEVQFLDVKGSLEVSLEVYLYVAMLELLFRHILHSKKVFL